MGLAGLLVIQGFVVILGFLVVLGSLGFLGILGFLATLAFCSASSNTPPVHQKALAIFSPFHPFTFKRRRQPHKNLNNVS